MLRVSATLTSFRRASLIQEDCFLRRSTIYSSVRHRFPTGFVFYYGSCRDYWNPKSTWRAADDDAVCREVVVVQRRSFVRNRCGNLTPTICQLSGGAITAFCPSRLPTPSQKRRETGLRVRNPHQTIGSLDRNKDEPESLQERAPGRERTRTHRKPRRATVWQLSESPNVAPASLDVLRAPTAASLHQPGDPNVRRASRPPPLWARFYQHFLDLLVENITNLRLSFERVFICA